MSAGLRHLRNEIRKSGKAHSSMGRLNLKNAYHIR